jgi:hypothetical protein
MFTHTPGPWVWTNQYGYDKSVRLVSDCPGKLYVMGAVRSGMQSATFQFSDRKDNLGGILHRVTRQEDIRLYADAMLIARAPDLYEENVKLKELMDRMAEGLYIMARECKALEPSAQKDWAILMAKALAFEAEELLK